MLVDRINSPRKKIAATFLKIGDESMSAINFWTTVREE